MSEREFDEYLRELSGRLGRRLRTEEIDGELRCHLEEEFDELLAAGVSRDEAIQRTLADFGDSATLAVSLTQAGHGRQRRQFLRWSGGASVALAAALMLLIAMWPERARVPLAPAVSAQAKPGDGGAKPEGGPDVEVDRLLAKRVTFDFVETPLSDVASFLSDAVDASIQLDRVALEGAGIGADRPVSLAVKDIPLEIALNRLCGTLVELNWTYRDEAFELTTKEAIEARPESRTYDVRDLLAPRDRTGSGRNLAPSAIELIEAIQSSLEPGNWLEEGGLGRAAISDGILIITHSWPIQHQVGRLLTDLRQASELASQAASGKERTASTPIALPVPNAATKKILEKLAVRQASIDFVDTSLSDVCAFLSSTHEFPFLLDRHNMEDAGVGTDRPVTLKQRSSTLQSTLNRLTREVNLAWTVSDESILVTSREALEQRLTYRVYPVADLVVGDDEETRADSLEALVELITSHVASQDSSWNDNGGVGRALALTEHATIVVSQTAPAHLELERFLEDLRAARKRGGGGSVPAIDPNSRVLTVYLFPLQGNEVNLTDLSKMIVELIEPASWKGSPDTFINPIGNRLVVRQSPAVQRKIRRFLQRDMCLPFSIPAQQHGMNLVPPVVGGVGGGVGGGGGLGGGGGFF